MQWRLILTFVLCLCICCTQNNQLDQPLVTNSGPLITTPLITVSTTEPKVDNTLPWMPPEPKVDIPKETKEPTKEPTDIVGIPSGEQIPLWLELLGNKQLVIYLSGAATLIGYTVWKRRGKK